MRIKLKVTFMLLFVFIICLTLPVDVLSKQPSPTSESPAISEKCPGINTLKKDLKEGIKNLQDIQIRINNLLSGKEVVQGGIGALFLVDLNDEKEVAKRIEELKKSASDEHTAINIVPDHILECGAKSVSTRFLVERLTELQRNVDILSLKFLQLPKEKRDSMLQIHADATKQSAEIESLKEEQSNAQSKKKEAENALKKATNMALTPKSSASGDLASERAVLEKVKMDIANIEIQFNNNKKQEELSYQNNLNKLAAIEGSVRHDNHIEKVKRNYKKIVKVWRKIVDKTLVTDNNKIDNSMVPRLPEYPANLLSKLKSSPEGRDYIKSYNEAKRYRNSLIKNIDKNSHDERNRLYSLILEVGRIRVMLLDRLIESGEISSFAFSKEHLEDLKREIKMFPYRWGIMFYFQQQTIKKLVSQGSPGVMKLLKAIFINYGLFIFSMLLLFRNTLLLKKMHRIRFYLLSKRNISDVASFLAIWLNRLIPYLNWLIILLVLEINRIIMLKSIFNLITPTLIIPYAEIYCIYKIVSMFLSSFLSALYVQAQTSETTYARKLIIHSERPVSLLFMYSCITLITVDVLLRKAILYRLTFQIVTVIAMIMSIWIAYKWRNELTMIMEKYYKGKIVKKLTSFCNKIYGIIFCLPVAFIVLFLFLIKWLRKIGEHYEFYKWISVKFYKRKLQSSQVKDNKSKDYSIPDDYKKLFLQEASHDISIAINLKNDLLYEIKENIINWEKGRAEEHHIVIYGEGGTGKSCLLRRLEKELNDLKVIRTAIPARLLSIEDVLTFIGNLFGIKTSDLNLVKDTYKNMPKTVLLIDDIHNLFLSTIGGFEGFKAFIYIVNTTSQNLFWCLAFNSFSWGYLDSIFGYNHYVNIIKRMPQWSDKEIQNLIISRHKQTDYKLSYENVIEAAGDRNGFSGFNYVVSNFFRLLWEQSNGNPKAALHFWLSALQQDGDGTFKVTLPQEPGSELVSNLPEDGLFVYAEILRHENLTLYETIEVTNLPEGVVKQTLETGIQRKIIYLGNDNRYRIAARYQYPLIKILKLKNFVYGN